VPHPHHPNRRSAHPDKLNRLRTVTDALGGVTTYAYDGNGNLTAITNALGHT
jgi:YD repeat-containing protein